MRYTGAGGMSWPKRVWWSWASNSAMAGVTRKPSVPGRTQRLLAGLQWTFDNKNKLGVSRIILSGESGGGNLALATCLRAKREGRLNQVAGVYALCPYIYGAWEQPNKELVSLVENDGYLIDVKTTPVLAAAYDPEETWRESSSVAISRDS